MGHSVTCMFIWYKNDHKRACHQMYNPETKILYETKDDAWLKQLYFLNKLLAGDSQIIEATSTEIRESNINELLVVAGENRCTVLKDSANGKVKNE